MKDLKISKELLSEVLGIYPALVDYNEQTNEIELRNLNNDGECVGGGSINIYELAHKCKEWALSKDYVISSYSKYKLDGYNCTIYCNNGEIDEDFTSDTESVAIFKACQWILKGQK